MIEKQKKDKNMTESSSPLPLLGLCSGVAIGWILKSYIQSDDEWEADEGETEQKQPPDEEETDIINRLKKEVDFNQLFIMGLVHTLEDYETRFGSTVEANIYRNYIEHVFRYKKTNF